MSMEMDTNADYEGSFINRSTVHVFGWKFGNMEK